LAQGLKGAASGAQESASNVQGVGMSSAMQAEKSWKAQPCMFDQLHAPVGEEKRHVPGPQSGFGAVLNKHPEGHDRHFMETTNSAFYTQAEITKGCTGGQRSSGAGMTSQDAENKKDGKKVGQLCAERLKESTNLAEDTRTQRAWLPSAPELRHVDCGGAIPVAPEVDNELSLPLGTGAMGRVRKELEARGGVMSKVTTDITAGVAIASITRGS